MKRIYLIRHGLPDFPEGEKMCLGSTDLPMGSEGLAQAARMAQALPPVSAVFSSPLTRALQTAGAIGLPVTVLQDLRELDAGLWDGLTFRQIRSRFPKLYEARGSDPSLPPPGGEDYALGQVRFRKAMEKAAASAPGDLAVVAHGGVISLFLQHSFGLRLKPDYAQAVELTYCNGEFQLSGGYDHA